MWTERSRFFHFLIGGKAASGPLSFNVFIAGLALSYEHSMKYMCVFMSYFCFLFTSVCNVCNAF